jgi:hypothetical protein
MVTRGGATCCFSRCIHVPMTTQAEDGSKLL